MKYFTDIEKLYEKLFVISKYCPILNRNVNTIFTDMNNIESSTDSNSSNEEHNTNNNIMRIKIFFHLFSYCYRENSNSSIGTLVL